MRRIAHISDLHFGAIDEAIVEELVRDLNEMSPDLVIVTGDLTQRARTEQFEQAREFLRRLSVARLVVPGNHDVAPLYRPASRLLDPYRRYRRYIHDQLDTTFLDDAILAVGLNTADPLRWKEGGLSPRQLDWLRERVRDKGQRFCVVASHHPLIRPDDPVRNGETLLHALEHAGVDMLLSGHLHETFSLAAAARVGAAESLLVAQASTATSTRLRGHANAYNRITVQPGAARIDVRVWHGERFSTESPTSYRRRGDSWVEERASSDESVARA